MGRVIRRNMMQTRTTPVLARVRDIWKKIPPVKQLVKKVSFRTAAFAFVLLTYFWKRSSSRTSKHEPEKDVDVPESPPSNLNMDEFIAKRKDTDEQDDWGQYVDMSSVRYVETPRNPEEEPASCRSEGPAQFDRFSELFETFVRTPPSREMTHERKETK